MDQEDALLFIVQALRTGAAQFSSYGYELYIPKVIHAWRPRC